MEEHLVNCVQHHQVAVDLASLRQLVQKIADHDSAISKDGVVPPASTSLTLTAPKSAGRSMYLIGCSGVLRDMTR
jgi:hypothetical protein